GFTLGGAGGAIALLPACCADSDSTGLVIDGARFDGNTAAFVGGGLYVGQDVDGLRIRQSTFLGNKASTPFFVAGDVQARGGGGGDGGAIFFDETFSGMSNMLIGPSAANQVRNRFENNSATCRGGAIATAGFSDGL